MMPTNNFQMVQHTIIYGERGEEKIKEGKRNRRAGKESSRGRNHDCPHGVWHISNCRGIGIQGHLEPLYSRSSQMHWDTI